MCKPVQPGLFLARLRTLKYFASTSGRGVPSGYFLYFLFSVLHGCRRSWNSVLLLPSLNVICPIVIFLGQHQPIYLPAIAKPIFMLGWRARGGNDAGERGRWGTWETQFGFHLGLKYRSGAASLTIALAPGVCRCGVKAARVLQKKMPGRTTHSYVHLTSSQLQSCVFAAQW